MLLESITLVFQLFVNIWTYDHLYAYDGPTTFMYLYLKKRKKNLQCEGTQTVCSNLLWISESVVGAYQNSLTNWFSYLVP